jgi:hypothetical protein
MRRGSKRCPVASLTRRLDSYGTSSREKIPVPAARPASCCGSSPCDRWGLVGAPPTEVSDQGVDATARALVASSVLRLAPSTAGGLTVALSGFLAYPELAFKLATLGAVLDREEWSSGTDRLEEINGLLRRSGGNDAPALAFVLTSDTAGRLSASHVRPLAQQLLLPSGELVGGDREPERFPLAADRGIDSVQALLFILLSTLTAEQLQLLAIDVSQARFTRWGQMPHMAAPSRTARRAW